MKNIFTFKQKRMVFFGFEAGNTEPDQLGVTVPRKKSPEESRKEEEENKRKRDEAEKRGKEETERNIKEYKEEMPKILHEYSDVIKKNESSGKVTYRVDHEVVATLDIYCQLEENTDGTLTANVNQLNVVDANKNVESFSGERMNMSTLRSYLAAVRKMIESYKKKK